MVSTSTFMFVQITRFFPGSFHFFRFHFHSQSTFPLPLLQPAQLLLFFSYDYPPFTLFSCLSARCLRFHFRQTMPYLPWHFLLSSCLSCTCCHSYLPTYSPVLAAMPVPSKTHRCLFYCLHFLPLQTNPARMLPVPAVLPGIQ